MGAYTTTGKVKIGVALAPDTYELLKELAPGRRSLGSFLTDLIRGEAAQRGLVASRIGAMRDISERKQTEAREQQARQTLETLHSAGAALASSLDLDGVLESLLDHLGELIPYDSANVMLRTGEATVSVTALRGYERWTDPAVARRVTLDVHTNPLIRQVIEEQKSLLVPDTTRCADWQTPPGAEHVRSWLAVPLMVNGRVLGLFSVDKVDPDFFRAEHVHLAEALAPQAATAVQNARLYREVQARRTQLQSLSRRLVQLQEQERRALSRDLHDTSGQSITALKLGLGSLARGHDCSEETRARVDELLALADTVSEDLHRLAVNLRPATLDRYGLVPALEQLLTEFRKQSGLDVVFAAPGMRDRYERLPGEVETALYRIVQECLTNVARYAHAETVSVVLQQTDAGVQVVVEDDGRGFDVEAAMAGGRLGLLGMRERAEMLGGALEIESSPGRGASVYATVPAPWDNRAASAQPDAPMAARMAPASPVPPAGVPSDPDPRLAEAAELARAKVLGDTLIDITTGMARCANAAEVLRLALARSAQAIGCDIAHVALHEDRRWRVRYRIPHASPGEEYSDPDAPAWTWVERTRQVLVVNDTSALALDRAFRLAEYGIKSYACLPLLAGETLLGVLTLVNYTAPISFHTSEVEFLNRLATLVSLALENLVLRETAVRQQDELRQRVEELQSIFELLPVGVLVSRDAECRFMESNPWFAEMVGLPVEANSSLSADEADRPRNFKACRDGRELAPDELPMQRAARTGVPQSNAAFDIVRDDGKVLAMVGTAVPLFDAEGRPRGAIGAFMDLTEQTRAQAEQRRLREELRESQALYQTLQDTIPDLVWSTDASGRVDYVNRRWQEYTGLTLDEVNALGWRTLNHPDDVPGQAANWAASVAEGRPFESEYRYRQHDGVYRWFWGRALPIKDENGRIVRWVGVSTDVEDRKQAEAELRRAHDELELRVRERTAELETTGEELKAANRSLHAAMRALRTQLERLRAQAQLLDLTHDAIFVRDLDGIIRFWNRGAAEMYGWTPAEAEGQNADALLGTQFPQPLGQIMDEVMACGRWDGELAHVTRDGVPIWVASRWALQRDDRGDPVGLLEINNDISRRRLAEAAILQQSRRRELLHQIDCSILANRAPGEIAQAAVETIREATGARRVTVTLYDIPSDAAIVLAAAGAESSQIVAGSRWPLSASWKIGEVRAGHAAYVEDLAALPDDDAFKASRLADGIQSAAMVPVSAGGEVIGQMTVGRAERGPLPPDVAEFAAEVADSLAIAIHNAQLQEKVQAGQAQLAETAARLQALSRRLVEKQERERSYVADRLYNEASQVLAALKIQAGRLERDLKHDPASTGWLHDLSDRLDQTLAGLHRLASDLRPAVLDRLGLAAALQQYLAEFGPQHGIATTCIARDLRGVRLSGQVETCVYRVMEEAVDNVAQHAQAAHLGVSLTRPGSRLLMVVEDDGGGFDPEEALKQGGVGLVGMRERVEALGGSLEIESRPGAGTTVVLEIPLA